MNLPEGILEECGKAALDAVQAIVTKAVVEDRAIGVTMGAYVTWATFTGLSKSVEKTLIDLGLPVPSLE